MRAPRTLLAALALAGAATLAACSGDDTASRQTIEVTMVDNAFQPDRITVPRGEKVTLRFTNEGTVTHEAMVGDDAAQMDHHRKMEEGANDDGHGGGHGSSDGSVTVEPGEQRSMTVTVDGDEDEVFIGCHEPGHWEDGMKATMSAR